MSFDPNNFFVISVFIAGVLSFFSPCILPVIPVYIGLLSDDVGEKGIRIFKKKIYTKPIIRTCLFVLGLSTVFVLLGFGAGTLGSIINSRWTTVVMGVVVIILGLHQGDFINLKFAQKTVKIDVKERRQKGYLGAFLLGLSFSFGWTPCIGPVLTSIIAISASGNGIYGLTLMGVYSIGMAIPFLIISVMSSILLKHMVEVKRHMGLIKRIGGIIIILMGILLIAGQANVLRGLF